MGNIKSDNRKQLIFLAGTQIEDIIYFSAWEFNGLFRLNPKTGESVFLKYFDGEEAEHLHSNSIYYEGCLWFIPSNSNRIARVDIKTLEISYIPLPEKGKEIFLRNRAGRANHKLNCCYKEGEHYLWLTPRAYNLLLRLDLETNELTVCAEWKENRILFSDSKRINDEIWMCPYDCGNGVIYNVISGELRNYAFDEKLCEYVNLAFYENKMYFFPIHLKNKIVVMDCSTHKKHYIVCSEKQISCHTLFTSKNQAILVPFEGKDGIILDLDEERAYSVYHLPQESIMPEIEHGYYFLAKAYGSEIWLLPLVTGNPVMKYDLRAKKFSYIEIWIGRENYESYIVGLINRYGREQFLGNIVSEKDFFLKSLIRIVSAEQSKSFEIKEENIGSKIYGWLKNGDHNV